MSMKKNVAVLDGAAVRAMLKRIGSNPTQLAKFVRLHKSEVSKVLNGRPVCAEHTYRIALALEQMARGAR